MASQEESIREFVAVTDVDEERARFFLESAGWNLQLALASFFEDGADDDIVTLPQPEGGSSVSRSAGPSILGREVAEVEEYRYLGVTIDNRLSWKSNSTAVYKKASSRLLS